MKSMTGYGSARGEYEDGTFSAELRSVNHRYKDFNIRAPKTAAPLEERIRRAVGEVMSRGHIDVFINYEPAAAKAAIVCDRTAAAAYMEMIAGLKNDFPALNDNFGVAELLRMPGVITAEDNTADTEKLWEELSPVLTRALVMLDKARIAEGEALKADFTARLAFLESKIAAVEALSDELPRNYYESLKKHTEDYKSGIIDEDRLMTELALFADRINITEETVRFRAHLNAFLQALNADEPVGRKLDFTLQEINREANTIASKSNSFEISAIAVEIKAELEKIREQVQNIE